MINFYNSKQKFIRVCYGNIDFIIDKVYEYRKKIMGNISYLILLSMFIIIIYSNCKIDYLFFSVISYWIILLLSEIILYFIKFYFALIKKKMYGIKRYDRCVNKC